MKKSNLDPLSELLRRGDSAADQAEANPVDARTSALLARCAADTPANRDIRVASPVFEHRRFEKRRVAFMTAGGALASAAIGAFFIVHIQNRDAAHKVPPLAARATPYPAVPPTQTPPARTSREIEKLPEALTDHEKTPKSAVLVAPRLRRTSRRAPSVVSGLLATRSPARQYRRDVPEVAPTAASSRTVAVRSPTAPEAAEPVAALARERVIIETDDTTVPPNRSNPPTAETDGKTASVGIVLTPQSRMVIVARAAVASAVN